MSRIKSRQSTEVCADCGSTEPTWASVNRGIFLCVQCCSIHRELGSHISQVKSLQSSNWSGSQLELVQVLNSNGVNKFWEHMLLENGSKLSKMKPTAKDPLEAKSTFIKAKHVHCSYAFRPNNEDGLLCVENELGKSLHASVRTSSIDTSFRYLIQGADPNYFHDEKGSTPLHVAAKRNQVLQAELLIIYGADPTYPDVYGKTPIDYAKQKGHKDLANRLIECQFEVTDKFSHYLCLRKPDHLNGIHLLIPQNCPKSDPNMINKLRKLHNQSFEELGMDIYDEIDRREIEAIWLSSSDSVRLIGLPFLPHDPTLSPVRNQSRQKLGKFSSPELKALVYDMLVETHRRQITSDKQSLISKGLDVSKLRELSHVSDDDPLYDSVASDEDYAVVPETNEQEENATHDKELTLPKTEDIENTTANSVNHCRDDSADLEILTKKLLVSDSTISELKQEVNTLKNIVERLNTENYELRIRLSQNEMNSPKGSVSGDSGIYSIDAVLVGQDQKVNLTNGQLAIRNEIRNGRKSQRPLSMYETREGLRTPNWQNLKNQLKQNDTSRGVTQSLYNSSQNDVILQCTEHITKGIQQLIQSVQSCGKENCIPYADKIRCAVTTLSAHIQSDNKGETVRRLLECVSQLQIICTSLQDASKRGDTKQVTMYLHKVREWAYETAKETKQVVTKYSI